jgi:hypothetical protein
VAGHNYLGRAVRIVVAEQRRAVDSVFRESCGSGLVLRRLCRLKSASPMLARNRSARTMAHDFSVTAKTTQNSSPRFRATRSAGSVAAAHNSTASPRKAHRR